MVQVSSISFNSGTTGNAYMGLYTDYGGAPQSLLGSTNVSYGVGWNTSSLAPLYVPAGANYWIALSPYGTAGNFRAIASGSYTTYTGSASALPQVLGVPPYTFFATYSGYTMAAQVNYCQ